MGLGGRGDTARKTWDVRGSRRSLVKEATARGIFSPGRNGEVGSGSPILGSVELGTQLERICLTPQSHSLVPSEPHLPTPISPGPPAPRHLHAQALSDSEIQLMWQRPEAPAGPISKYIVEVQVAGGSGDPLWMDVDRPEETSTIVRGLNASTRYLFRVRASVQGPGDWSNVVEQSTLGNGEMRGCPGHGVSLGALPGT